MLASIANTFSNCFKIPELKSRIGFTVLLLAICRVIAFIRIPGLDGVALADFFQHQSGGGGGMLGMYSLFTTGVALWLLYGISLGEWPIIMANAVTLGLAALILGMKLRSLRSRME